MPETMLLRLEAAPQSASWQSQPSLDSELSAQPHSGFRLGVFNRKRPRPSPLSSDSKMLNVMSLLQSTRCLHRTVQQQHGSLRTGSASPGPSLAESIIDDFQRFSMLPLQEQAQDLVLNCHRFV